MGETVLARLLQLLNALIYWALFCPLVITAQNDPATDFDVPELDVTEHADTDAPSDSPWHHTLAYQHGWAEQGGSIADRVSWRAQWENLWHDYFFVLDGKILVYGDKDRSADANEDYSVESRLRSLYVQSGRQSWSAKFGYQMIGIGLMDIVTINDVLSPWDFSEPVYTSPEDARFGQAMLTLAYFRQSTRLSLYVNTQPETNRYPYQILISSAQTQLGIPAIALEDNQPDAFEQSETLLRLQITQGKNEYELVAGSLLQNDAAIVPVNIFTPVPIIRLEYPRYTLVGAAMSHNAGNYLWKIESAYKQDIQPLDLFGLQVDSYDLGVGMEYTSPRQFSLGVEGSRFFRDVPDILSNVVKDPWLIGTRWNKNFIHDTLGVVMFASYAKPGPIITESLAINYKPVDNLILEMIYSHFDTDDNNLLANFIDQASSVSLQLSYHW